MKTRTASLYELLLDLDQNKAVGQSCTRVHQGDEAVSLAQAIEPHARPGGQIILANLVIPHSEAHKGQLVHQARDVSEDEPLAAEVDVAAPVGLGPDLVLALAFVAVVVDVAATKTLEGVDVELDLDVGLEALG